MTLDNFLYNFFAWAFNPFTGNFDYYQVGGTTDPATLVGNVLTEIGDDTLLETGSFMLMETG